MDDALFSAFMSRYNKLDPADFLERDARFAQALLELLRHLALFQCVLGRYDAARHHAHQMHVQGYHAEACTCLDFRRNAEGLVLAD